jgi:hypothetical protein
MYVSERMEMKSASSRDVSMLFVNAVSYVIAFNFANVTTVILLISSVTYVAIVSTYANVVKIGFSKD